MTVTVGPTYLDITVDADTVNLVFPDEAQGSIRPGSLNHLTKLEIIVWGKNMIDLIEPGTIPNGVYLVLREEYKHSVDLSKLEPGIYVYTHAFNCDTAPTDRCFTIWGNFKDVQTVEPDLCKLDHEHGNMPSARSIFNGDMGMRNILWSCSYPATKVPVVVSLEPESTLVPELESTLVPELESTPEPEPELEESIEDRQTRVSNEFIKLCQEADFATISAYITANKEHLDTGYRELAVLRKFTERRDMDLCKLVHKEIRPTRAVCVQSLIKQNARTAALAFVLDLAEELKISPFTSLVNYRAFLSKVCISDASLELAKRAYNLWATPDPFYALGGACYSHNREKIDYFFGLCKEAVNAIASQKVTAFNRTAGSANLYAFGRLVRELDIDLVTILTVSTTGTQENTLVYNINNCSRDTTGATLEILMQYLTKAHKHEFTRETINLYTGSEFWKQYAEAIVTLCKDGHAGAVSFFMKRMIVDTKQVKTFIEAASSDEVVKSIIETAAPSLTLDSATDLIKSIENPTRREHVIAYYKSVFDQLLTPQ